MLEPKKTTRGKAAAALNIDPDTLRKLLRSVGIPPRELLTLADVETINRKICHPLFFGMTREKLARVYGISPDTFFSWLSEINITPRKKLLLQDLDTIYSRFGVPAWLKEINITIDDAPSQEQADFFYQLLEDDGELEKIRQQAVNKLFGNH